MSLAKNSVATFVTLMAASVIGVAWSTITSRLLGPTGVGILAVITFYSTLLFVAGNMTLGLSTVYQLGNSRASAGQLAGNALLMCLAVGSALYLLAVLTIGSVGDLLYKGISATYLYIGFTVTVFNLIVYNMMSVLQGLGRIRDYNLVYLSRGSVGLVAILAILAIVSLAAIQVADYLLIVVTVLAITFMTTAVLSLYLVTRQIRGKWDTDWTLLKNTLTIGAKIHIATVATFVYSQVGVLVVNHYLGSADAGYLYIALMFAQFIAFVPLAVQTVLYPAVANGTADSARDLCIAASRHTVFWSTLLAVALGLSSSLVIQILLGTVFLPAAQLLVVLLPGVVLSVVAQVLAALWVKRGWLWLMAASGVLVSVVGVLLQILLVRQLGVIGAAAATSLTYLVGFGIVLAVHYSRTDKRVWLLLWPQRGDIVVYKQLWSRIRSWHAN